MKNTLPLRFREIDQDHMFVADDAGRFFKADNEFVGRYATSKLNQRDLTYLKNRGMVFNDQMDISYSSFISTWAKRQYSPSRKAYLILVPTLRCDLNCTYCQVSRAPIGAKGFDWTEEKADQAIDYILSLDVDEVQIEFQGGEPFLRLDLIQKIFKKIRQHISKSSFVVCTNLQNLSPEIIEFAKNRDVFISTSLDGPTNHHSRNRTKSEKLTNEFQNNLKKLISTIGIEKVSALPTIDLNTPPTPHELIDEFDKYGIHSIYLRPVNYQGFARKQHPKSIGVDDWLDYYNKFIKEIISRNFRSKKIISEFYLVHILKRILGPGHDGHTDLRNPNVPTALNVVIDFDGKIYPSDEARMLARIRKIDLSIGALGAGVDSNKINAIAPAFINNFDAECIHCPYQVYCGSDPVDDLSRSGRIDIPKRDTWFCRRHLAIFDLAIKLIYSNDPKVEFSILNWLNIKELPHELRPSLS